MSFFGETTAMAAHAEGSLYTFITNNNDTSSEAKAMKEQQRFEQPSNQRYVAQNQHQQRLATLSPLQAVIAMANRHSLQDPSIWEPRALRRLRRRLVASSVNSVNTAPVTDATKNNSIWMHQWTNPMTGMDLIPTERPNSSIMKVRTLYESIESTYVEGSGRKKSPVALGTPTIQAVQQAKMFQLGRSFDASCTIKLGCMAALYVVCLCRISMMDLQTQIIITGSAMVGTLFAFHRFVLDCKRRERQRLIRRRQQTPHYFVDLQEKPLHQGPKKSRWQAWVRDDPHNDIATDSFLLFRDRGRITRFVKRATVAKVATQCKALLFIEKVGVKMIPLFWDECNANAYCKGLRDLAKKNSNEVKQELAVTHKWKQTFTDKVLSAFPLHYANLTFKWHLLAAEALAKSMEAPPKSNTPPRKFRRVDYESCFYDHEDSTPANVEFPSTDRDEANDENAAISTHDLEENDQDSVNDFFYSDQDSITNNELSPIDSDEDINIFVAIDTSNIESTSSGTSSNTLRGRVPRPHRRTTIKSTELEVLEATVWVDGRRRSSRLRRKTGSVWVNGQRKSARFLGSSS